MVQLNTSFNCKNPEKTRPLLPCKMSIGVIWCPSTSWTPGAEPYLKKMAEEAARWLSRRLEAWIVLDSYVISASIMRPLLQGRRGWSTLWRRISALRIWPAWRTFKRELHETNLVRSLYWSSFNTEPHRWDACVVCWKEKTPFLLLRAFRYFLIRRYLNIFSRRASNLMKHQYWKFQEVEDLSKPINMTDSYQ